MRRLQSASSVFRILIVMIIFPMNLSFAQQLPSSKEFRDLLRSCAAGVGGEVEADLLGSIETIYDGDKTQGKAKFRDVGAFLDALPEDHRLQGYKLYLECIEKFLPKKVSLSSSSIELLRWPMGGWDIQFFNPTKRVVSVTRAELVADDPDASKPNLAFVGRFLKVGQYDNPRSIAPGTTPILGLRLFGPGFGCQNWKVLRSLRFQNQKGFNSWSCAVNFQLRAIDGEATTIGDGFACSRIPVPPPNC